MPHAQRHLAVLLHELFFSCLCAILDVFISNRKGNVYRVMGFKDRESFQRAASAEVHDAHQSKPEAMTAHRDSPKIRGPHTCPLCRRAFTSQGLLATHMLSHVVRSERRPLPAEEATSKPQTGSTRNSVLIALLNGTSGGEKNDLADPKTTLGPSPPKTRTESPKSVPMAKTIDPKTSILKTNNISYSLPILSAKNASPELTEPAKKSLLFPANVKRVPVVPVRTESTVRVEPERYGSVINLDSTNNNSTNNISTSNTREVEGLIPRPTDHPRGPPFPPYPTIVTRPSGLPSGPRILFKNFKYNNNSNNSVRSVLQSNSGGGRAAVSAPPSELKIQSVVAQQQQPQRTTSTNGSANPAQLDRILNNSEITLTTVTAAGSNAGGKTHSTFTTGSGTSAGLRNILPTPSSVAPPTHLTPTINTPTFSSGMSLMNQLRKTAPPLAAPQQQQMAAGAPSNVYYMMPMDQSGPPRPTPTGHILSSDPCLRMGPLNTCLGSFINGAHSQRPSPARAPPVTRPVRKAVPCQMCPLSFPTVASFQAHFNQTHTMALAPPPIQYKCKRCSWMGTSVQQMKGHEATCVHKQRNQDSPHIANTGSGAPTVDVPLVRAKDKHQQQPEVTLSLSSLPEIEIIEARTVAESQPVDFRSYVTVTPIFPEATPTDAGDCSPETEVTRLRPEASIVKKIPEMEKVSVNVAQPEVVDISAYSSRPNNTTARPEVVVSIPEKFSVAIPETEEDMEAETLVMDLSVSSSIVEPEAASGSPPLASCSSTKTSCPAKRPRVDEPEVPPPTNLAVAVLDMDKFRANEGLLRNMGVVGFVSFAELRSFRSGESSTGTPNFIKKV